MGLSRDFVERLEADWGTDRDVLVSGAADAAALAEIRDYAGFELPASYADFVSRYGAGIVGPFPVYGRGEVDALGAMVSVEEITRRFRNDGWPGTNVGLVISMDHAGNPMTLVPDGSVFRFDHDAGEAEEIALSFEAFLDWCLSR